MKYFDLNVPLQVHMSDTGENRNSFESARTPVAISVLAGSVYGNEFLAMLDAFHNVIHSFLTADRVNKLFHRGANETSPLAPHPFAGHLNSACLVNSIRTFQKDSMSSMRLAML